MIVPFFITKLSFDLEVLQVCLGKANLPWQTIKFIHPRAFRFFNESDNFSYLMDYSGTVLLSGGEGCWISESETAPYVREYLNSTPSSRLEPGLRSILIVTPQECVEVISFERPEIGAHSNSI